MSLATLPVLLTDFSFSHTPLLLAICHFYQVWLGLGERDSHDAVADAVLSMRLFQAYTAVQHDAKSVYTMSERVLAQKPKPSFAKLHPEWEGCCMGNRQTCKCGAPFFS